MRGLKAGEMHKVTSVALPTLMSALMLGGCAGGKGDFPSLSKRPYETSNPVEEPVAVPQPATTVLPADLKAQTDMLLARARAAHSKFEAALPAARLAAESAKGSAAGSEGWVEANMLLSRADGARGDAVAGLGEIDELIAERREQGGDPGLLALLAVPQGQIAAMVNEETVEIDRLALLIGL